jgi:hypothetical protein
MCVYFLLTLDPFQRVPDLLKITVPFSPMKHGGYLSVNGGSGWARERRPKFRKTYRRRFRKENGEERRKGTERDGVTGGRTKIPMTA